jgi:ABC-2 type transport system ATP-binding protein
MSAPFLDVVDLRKNYGGTVALAGVTFQVTEGEIFGLLGPNGAGKTTLLSILSCLLEATSGSARLLGRELVPSDREVRRLLGIVPQELALYDDLTATENLLFFGELYGLMGTDLRGQASSILTAVGLEEKADDRVRTFSGGMKRRLNLGAALMHRPRLLLLDEPTVGVDPQSRNRIFDEVRRLNGQGTTIVYTSHYMEEVQALCRRVGIIDQGRLQACDTVENLLHELEGLIRCRVHPFVPELKARLGELPGCRLTIRPPGRPAPAAEATEPELELSCRDVKATLVRVVAVLNELQIELVSLETEEPNLERVFLHRTGKALRD